MTQRGPGVRFGLRAYERLKAVAIAERAPVSRLIEEAIDRYVDRLEFRRGKRYRKSQKALPVGRPKDSE